MTAERDGKSRRTGQPDLLASLPDERPAPGIDSAAIEELLTEVRDLREQVAGPREAEAADRPAPVPAAVPQALTLEGLEAWGDKHVARVAEAARTADAPGDEAAAARIERIEDAAAKAAAAAERIAGGLESTADRVTAEVEGAVTRIETGLATTRNANRQQSRQADPILEEILTRTAGLRFGWRAVLCVLDRLRPGHVAREPHTHPLQLAVSPMSRRRSPSLPLPRTGAALSGA